MTAQNEPIELVGVIQHDAGAADQAAPRDIFALVSLERRREPERGTFAGRAGHADASAHHVHELLRDRQAEACAAKSSRRGSIRLNERCEQALLIVLSDADAGVVDQEPEVRLATAVYFAHHRETHLATLGEL